MAATEEKLTPEAEHALQAITDHIGNAPHAWVKLVKSYHEIPAKTHEGAIAQAIALHDKYKDFQARFGKEVAGAHEKHFVFLLFDAIKMGLKVLGAIGKVLVKAITKAVQKHQEKKAEAAKAKAAEVQRKKAALEAAKKKEESKSKNIKIAGAIALIAVVLGLIYAATRND